MKPVDLKPSTYIESSKEINDEGPQFKIGDIVKISKFEVVFAKGYVPNWSEEAFVIKNVKNTVPWTYVIRDLNSKKFVERFTKKNCKIQIKESLELEK